MIDWLYLLVIIALSLFGVMFIRVIPERKRYAVISEGRFTRFVGPGIALKFPRRSEQWVPVGVGDTVQLMDRQAGMIGGVILPVEIHGMETKGAPCRITGFTEYAALVSCTDSGSQSFR